MGGTKPKDFLDELVTFVAVMIFLVAAPIAFIILTIISLVNLNQQTVFFSLGLIPIGLVYLLHLQRKARENWIAVFFLTTGIAFLVLPTVAALIVFRHNATCVNRIRSGADLRSCDLVGISFVESDLTGANFTKANLADADFTNANLTNAVLSDTNLSGTNFKDAILAGAIFDDADVSEARGITIEMLQSLGSWQGLVTADMLEDSLVIMAEVCDGKGYPGGLIYSGGPIQADELAELVFAVGDKQDFGIQWYPETSLASLQKSPPYLTSITVCVKGEEYYYETCRYSGVGGVSEVRRAKYNLTVEIRKTQTAELVTSKTFYADLPRECPEKVEQGSDGGVKEYVKFAEVETWIEGTISQGIGK